MYGGGLRTAHVRVTEGYQPGTYPDLTMLDTVVTGRPSVLFGHVPAGLSRLFSDYAQIDQLCPFTLDSDQRPNCTPSFTVGGFNALPGRSSTVYHLLVNKSSVQRCTPALSVGGYGAVPAGLMGDY